GLADGAGRQRLVALAQGGEPGAHVAGGQGGEVGDGGRAAEVTFEEGEVAPGGKAIGFQGASRGTPFLAQMDQPGVERLRARHRTGQRSAVRSTTRARKATSSAPMSAVKPSGSEEPKAKRPWRAGSQMAMRMMAMLCTSPARSPKRPSAVGS